MRLLPASLAAAAALVLAGCADDSHEDLRAFVQSATPPNQDTAATPAAPTPAQFSYGAASLRDPFQPSAATPAGGDHADTPPAPDLSRPKAPLEQFSIGQLHMVGTLARGGLIFALVQDAGGRVHRVGRGDFLGTDFGEVHAIDAAGMDIAEAISDGAGGWARRERRIPLAALGTAPEDSGAGA